MKSTVDDLEIQSRQVPYPWTLDPQWARSLAMNTAFAMRDGGAIVEVDKGTPLVLYIDRQRRQAHSGELIALSGGGTVQYTGKQVIVTWADGTTATLVSIGDEGVNLVVTPAQRAGTLWGLLGNDDGNYANDFVGREGHEYDAAKIQSVGLFVMTREQAQITLGGFGRSWRIAQAESLFVYPPGKSTSSYLVPGFPHVLFSLLTLGAKRRRAAERACRAAGVTNPWLLIGCEIDYGATGDRRLATATSGVQRAAHPREPTSPGALSGRWAGRYSGAYHGTFNLNWTQSGSKVSGTIELSSPKSELHIDGSVTGNSIQFGTVGSLAITYSGVVSGNSMSGSYSTPFGGGPWSASKVG